MREFFQRFFEDDPFDFQIEVAQHLLNGSSVILRAPTGAGKTRTALFPFLYARQQQILFPRQMIYSLPLRTLATSLYSETQAACKKAFSDPAIRPTVTIQTGEQPDDPQLRIGDIVFVTYDQSLSSFLTIPVGLSRREGNINAGAMVASYLVFDEFHLMEASRSLATMTAILEWLKGWTPFLLMTATLSETLVNRLATRLEAKAVTVAEGDLENIPSQRNKKRFFQVENRTLSAADILKDHQSRSIAVCNTVDRAQALFEQLCEASKTGIVDAKILLHSRFLPDDRAQIEAHIRSWFGKKPELRRNAILVATQAIEVGLDLTCEHLHTEIAPAAAIIQRAGRCARFPGEEGVVHIYDVPENENGSKSYLPYDAEGETPLCPATWAALLSETFNQRAIGFQQEQDLIERVYGEVDKNALTDIALNSRRSEIAGPNGVQTTQARADYRNLVRFVDSRSFFVHPNPETVENPLQMQTFSVSPGTLAHWWKEFDHYNIDQDHWFARLVVTEKRGDDDQAQRYIPPTYSYEPVTVSEKFHSEFFFVINPKFVDYSTTLGLRFRANGLPPDAVIKTRYKRDSFSSSYTLETYQEHIERVWQAYQSIFASKGRFDYIAEHLLQRHGVSFDYLIRSTIAAHDIGKLNRDWQKWVHTWQRDYKGMPVDPEGFYAHTDYIEAMDKKKQSSLNARFSRPPHAAEGAQAIGDVLFEIFPEAVARAAFSAIVRHHSPGANRVRCYQISEAAQAEASRVFSLITHEAWQQQWYPLFATSAQGVLEESVAEYLAIPDGMTNDTFLIYLLLVRALRISDQQSLANDL